MATAGRAGARRFWLLNSTGRWVAIAGVAFLSAVAVAGLCLAIYAAWLFHDLPDAGELAEYRPPPRPGSMLGTAP